MSTVMGCGLPRTGTSLVFQLLRHTPGVTTSPVKEWHYWDRLCKQQGNWQDDSLSLYPPGDVLTHNIKNPSSRFYIREGRLRRQFFRLAHDSAQMPKATSALERFAELMSLFDVGDFTPSNCLLTETQWKEIIGAIPKIKVVISVRNPINQVWSAFCNQQKKTNRPVNLDELKKYVARPGGGVAKADFEKILGALRSAGLTQQRLLIIEYDKLVNDIEGAAEQLRKFMCVDSSGIGKFDFQRFHSAKSSSLPLYSEAMTLLEDLLLPRLDTARNLTGFDLKL